MSKFSFRIVIDIEREIVMKKAFLSVLLMPFFCVLGISTSAYSSVSGYSGLPAVSPVASPNHCRTSFGILNINSMSPATYRYPSSYAHTTTQFITPYTGFSNVTVPGGSNIGNVNVYVGQPVYVMRSGMVKVNKKKTSKRRHIRTTYEEEYYED